MVESQSQTPLPRELCNQDLLPLIVQHLSTKQLFQTTAVSKSFQQSICVATTKPENPLRVWGRESCLSKRLPKGAPKPPSRWPVSEYSRKLEDGTKVPSLLKACHFIDRQWSSPGDLQVEATLWNGMLQALAAHCQHSHGPGPPEPDSQDSVGIWPASGGVHDKAGEDNDECCPVRAATNAMAAVFELGSDWQSLGFWGKLALFVLLVARRHRPHAVRVLRWAWAESAPERYSPLLRESVRELAACLLVLLRKPEWKHCRMSWAAELDAALDGELQRLEAWDDYNANAQRIAVHQQLAANLRLPPHYAPWPVLDPKLRAVTAIPLASLTAEQQTILTTALPAEAADCRDVSMTITAFAGTGKTSTLRALTEVHQDKQFLYVAYNKEVAKQAQREFNIRHVTCLTSHSVAGSMLRDMQRHGKVLCEGTLQLRPIADILRRYNAIEAIAKYTTNTFYGFARVVRAAVENFCTSVDLAVAGSHLPDPVEWPRVRAKPDYVAWSQHVWNCMCDPRNLAIQFTHNTYLKLFVLTQPELKHPYTHRPYDVILVDEAQDLNPITFQMIDRQPCTKIYVGDPHQHIYSFNGSCDMLSRVSAAKRFTLTCSFRLGPEVAMLANRLLAKLKGETRSIVGLGPAGCRVYVPGQRLTIQPLSPQRTPSVDTAGTDEQLAETAAVAQSGRARTLAAAAIAAMDASAGSDSGGAASGSSGGAAAAAAATGCADPEDEAAAAAVDRARGAGSVGEVDQPAAAAQGPVLMVGGVPVGVLVGPAPLQHTPPAPASPAGHAVGGDAADGSPAEGAPPSPQPSQEREVHRAVYRCMAMDVDCRAAVRRAAEAPDIDIGPAGVAMLPVDAATGRWPQLHYICRSNYGWLCAAAELVQKFPWIRLHLLVSMGKDWQTGAREPQIFGKVRDGFKLYTRSGRPNAADLKRFSDYAALKAYAKATEEPELLSIVRIIDKFKNETLAVLERVHAARISSPTSHHLHPFQRRMLRRRMLCWAPATRRRARSLTMCNWGTTSSHAPSRKTWVCQPRPSRKQLVDEHNLIYVAASRARHTLILNADLQNYLAQGMAQRLSVAKRDPELLARLACGLPNVGGPPGSPGDSPLAMCVCGICYKLAHPVQEGALDVVVGSNSSGGRLGLSLVCTECAGTSIYADLLRPPG